MKYDTQTINYINQNISLLDYVSQYTKLEKRKGEWWCRCPLPKHFNDDSPSFSINAEKNLFSCFGCHSSGTPIIFIQLYHKLSFPEAIQYLIDYANLKIEPREHSDVLEFLHKSNIKPKENKEFIREFLPNNIMDKYKDDFIVEWLNEGISQESLDKFEVRYDNYGNRIIFPIRDSVGNIIAIKGRTIYKNFRDLGIVKYIYYQAIGANDFLYGLYQNKKNIKEKKQCIIVEAEKGVIKLDSWGFDNAVAIGTSHVTKQQIELLLSLKCDLIFAFDKDVKEKDIIKQTKKMTMFTNVYYILDKNNLLKEKESPYDQGLNIWNKLYKDKYKIKGGYN